MGEGRRHMGPGPHPLTNRAACAVLPPLSLDPSPPLATAGPAPTPSDSWSRWAAAAPAAAPAPAACWLPPAAALVKLPVGVTLMGVDMGLGCGVAREVR